MSQPTSMTNEERDRLIAAAEELKIQRTQETCRRFVVEVAGSEYAPGRCMRDRYFIVNVPKAVLGNDIWGDAGRYIDSQRRFPRLFDLVLSGKYKVPRVVHVIGDGSEELEEIGG